MVMNDNEFETKENEICTKDKIEPQQIHGNSMSKQAWLDQIGIQYVVLGLDKKDVNEYFLSWKESSGLKFVRKLP